MKSKLNEAFSGEITLVHWTSTVAPSAHKNSRNLVSGGHFQTMDEFEGDMTELAALDSSDGDLTRLHLDSWLRSYQNESCMFSSLALFIEVKLREIQQASRGAPVPNAFRTAICCDMMYKLSSTLGTFSAAFQPLVKELFDSIYVQFDTRASSPFQATPYFLETQKLREKNKDLHSRMRDLLDEVNLRKARSTLNRGGLESVIRNWQSSIVTNTFRQWRAYVVHKKDKTEKLSVR